MKFHTRLLAVASTTLVIAAWLAAAPAEGPQADIRKIADALQKDDTKTAKTLAKSVAEKNGLDDVMHMFSLRTSKGEGIGPTAGAIKPDGIEAKLQNLTKRGPTKAELDKDGAALERMAYITAAIGEVALHKAPDKAPGKDPADWKKWTEEMSKHALELGKELKTGDAMKIKNVAMKLDNTCKNCHGVFRDS